MKKISLIQKAALVAGAFAAPLGVAGAAAASAEPAQMIGPIKTDICVSGPLGFVQGCVDTGRHRWWDGNRWWQGDRAWDGDDWHRFHDGPNWRHDNGRHRGWDKHDDDWRHHH
ncbi:MAG: hypothetical protein ACRC20_09845 [Segniliparus sp.]|uniref:hypothetical protein n=1 Tax=Segniliparus sp. TaxID=2804064 RepID=UPI003F3880CD